MTDLRPYLQALQRAKIRRAPPWPAAARAYMVANRCDLWGWYDDPDDNGCARIWIRTAGDPDAILATLSEEIVHHVDNALPEGAAKARATALLHYSVWRAAVARAVLQVLLRRR